MRDGKNFKLNMITPDGCTAELVRSDKLGKDAVLQQFQVSNEGDQFSFAYSLGGSDEGIFRMINTQTGEVLDELKGMIGSVAWLGKERYFYERFYAKEKTPDGISPPTARILLRENGKDEMVFGKGIPTSYFVSIKTSSTNSKCLLTVSFGWTKSDVYAGKLERPESWRLLYGKGDYIARPIDYIHGGYLVSSFDRGGMGRVLALNDRKETKEIVGEQEYPLQEAVVAGNRIVASYLADASSIIRIFSLDGKKLDEIKPQPPGSIASLDSDGTKSIFAYQSFLIPYRIYVLQSDELTILDSNEIKGDFHVEELWTKSKDSTRIHMFKTERRGKSQGKALVWGYGGFGIALTPSYFPYVIPFLEDGGTFVTVNLRGGTEFGEKWHREGMREKKQNVFDDFTAALETLKGKNSKTVGFGVSNGGLLIGTVMTQHPELLDGALIGYPVLDMLRFHKLHIGKAWVPEYGNPDDSEDAKFLTKYSPYHNVTRREYPSVMLYTGLHDDRVHPAHAFKFAAKLEENGAHPLLRVEMQSGHSGATPTTKAKEYSEIMAFVYRTLRIKMKSPLAACAR
jgi:prolyl oligopeptidase